MHVLIAISFGPGAHFSSRFFVSEIQIMAKFCTKICIQQQIIQFNSGTLKHWFDYWRQRTEKNLKLHLSSSLEISYLWTFSIFFYFHFFSPKIQGMYKILSEKWYQTNYLFFNKKPEQDINVLVSFWLQRKESMLPLMWEIFCSDKPFTNASVRPSFFKYFVKYVFYQHT